MSLKIFSRPHLISLDPTQQLSKIQLSLIQLQQLKQQNPSKFAETARKTVQALSYQFESLASVSMTPRNSSLRHCYNSVQDAFIKIQEQLKLIPQSQSRSASCFECVIL